MADENGKDNPQNDPADDQIDIDATLDAEAKIAAYEAQNKKLFARAKKAEGFTQEADGTWVKKPKPTEQPIIKKDESPRDTVKPSDILRADEFKLYRQGYSEQEIDLIMHNGGMKALADEKNPLVLGLKVAREQRQAEEAAARAKDTSGTSELERKYSNADLHKMSPAELEKLIGTANQ